MRAEAGARGVEAARLEERGEAVMLPFLQDTLRVDGLFATIGGLMLSSPLVAVEILVRLGPVSLARMGGQPNP